MSIGQFGAIGFQNRESITAEYVNIVGKGGLFLYQGSAAAGNLIASITNLSVDKYGNATLPEGVSVYDPATGEASELQNNALIFFLGTESTTWTQQAGLGLGGNPPSTYLSLSSILTGASVNLVWLWPSGDNTGTTDYNALVSALQPHTIAFMLPGIFYINESLPVPNSACVYGSNASFGVPIGNYGAGSLPLQQTIIQCTNTFANPNSGNGCIVLEQITGQGGGQRLQNLTLDSSNLPSGNNLHGIAIFNAIAAATIQDCTVYGGSGGAAGSLGGDCLHAISGGTQPPDLLTIMHNHFAGGSGWGATINGVADSYVAFNECTGNQLGGWNLTNGNNSRYVSNKGEQSKAGPGWKVTFATGFTGILHMLTNTCQDNFEDGIQITGPGTGYLKISDFAYDSDGQNGGAGGGGFGGVNINNFAGKVQLELLAGRVGSAYPEYGITITNLTGTVMLDNIIAAAITNGFNWDYSGTVMLGAYEFIPASPGSAWVVIGSTGAPAFGTGWSNVGSPNANVAYQRNGSKVIIKGYVNNSVAANTTAIFTLPASLTPASQQFFTMTEDPNSTITLKSLLVTTGGAVEMSPGLGGAGAGNYVIDAEVCLDI